MNTEHNRLHVDTKGRADTSDLEFTIDGIPPQDVKSLTVHLDAEDVNQLTVTYACDGVQIDGEFQVVHRCGLDEIEEADIPDRVSDTITLWEGGEVSEENVGLVNPREFREVRYCVFHGSLAFLGYDAPCHVGRGIPSLGACEFADKLLEK